MFGTSDPPPEVWTAYEKLQDSDNKDDKDLVIPFAYYHFGYPDDLFDEAIEVRGWAKFTKAFRREYLRVFRTTIPPTNVTSKSGLRPFMLRS